MSDDSDIKEWVDEFVESISSGELDKHLRRIVRAAFRRKYPERVIPSNVMPPPAVPAQLATGDQGQELFTGQLPKLTGSFHAGMFECDGNYYPKAAIVGKILEYEGYVLPKMRGVRWGTMRFLVVEINRTNVLLEMQNPPTRMTDRIRVCYQRRIPLSVSKTVLRPFLER